MRTEEGKGKITRKISRKQELGVEVHGKKAGKKVI